ncbi:hypothetical protein GCM10029978_116310 [Actinoallomurus acanthiterrae]
MLHRLSGAGLEVRTATATAGVGVHRRTGHAREPETVLMVRRHGTGRDGGVMSCGTGGCPIHTITASAIGPASDQKGASVDSAEQHKRKIRLLTDLVRELVGFGFQVGMSDARPAAFIRSATGRPSVVIAVTGDYFEWNSGTDSHVTTDPAGAAAAIAAHAWTLAGDAWLSGKRSGGTS